MTEKQNRVNRRNFLKVSSAAGLTALITAKKAAAESNVPALADPNEPEKTVPKVPRRRLGKTGIDIPCLSLGTNALDNQVVLRGTLRYGIDYWDTANGYVGGNSARNIGRFVARNPELRKDLFLTSKASGAKTIADVEDQLQKALKTMNTDYLDLFYGVHGLDDPARLTDELNQWAKSAKQRKLIRFFGFTTHKNMSQCLTAAAKLDWIDAIMTTYNFRLRRYPGMQQALDACHKAGIGLVAMKTVTFSGHEKRAIEAGEQTGETEEDKKIIDHFTNQRYNAMPNVPQRLPKPGYGQRASREYPPGR